MRAAATTALAEALSLAGLPDAALDVVFVGEADDLAGRLARQGLVYDVPAPAAPLGGTAPGSDPARPPKLL
jgi:hypothetical protein